LVSGNSCLKGNVIESGKRDVGKGKGGGQGGIGESTGG